MQHPARAWYLTRKGRHCLRWRGWLWQGPQGAPAIRHLFYQHPTVYTRRSVLHVLRPHSDLESVLHVLRPHLDPEQSHAPAALQRLSGVRVFTPEAARQMWWLAQLMLRVQCMHARTLTSA